MRFKRRQEITDQRPQGSDDALGLEILGRETKHVPDG
jgi:hypothetical protein